MQTGRAASSRGGTALNFSYGPNATNQQGSGLGKWEDKLQIQIINQVFHWKQMTNFARLIVTFGAAIKPAKVTTSAVATSVSISVALSTSLENLLAHLLFFFRLITGM